MIELVGFRWADWDTPLWVDDNRLAGRWHEVGDGPTQYWALHPLGPWAENLRMNGIRDAAALEDIASRTWAARFPFGEDEVNVISFDTARHHGIEPAALVDDDHAACRRLGASLRRTSAALVVPSAALPGTENLVVFGSRAMSPYGAEPPDRSLDVPAAVTAAGGRPPAALVDLVRHFGEVHAGLEAWTAGEPLPPPSIGYAR